MSELTPKAYWDNIRGGGKRIRVDAEFAQIVSSYMKGRVIELGCGDSHVLPYFASRCEMYGIDYSVPRLQQTMERLVELRRTANLRCQDFMTVPDMWEHSFDVVYSGGVIEHFVTPADTLRMFTAYMKSNGLMITTVPHLKGMWGTLGKMMNRAADNGYVRLDLEDLKLIHIEAGLKVILARYFRWMDFSVLNYDTLPLIARKMVYGGITLANPLRLKGTNLPEAGYADMIVVAKKC
jgi:trans-aconitate methyltransferase